MSHLLTLLGLAGGLTVPLIVIRTIAYLLVIFALYRILAQKQGSLAEWPPMADGGQFTADTRNWPTRVFAGCEPSTWEGRPGC